MKDEAILTMTISPAMEKIMKETFDLEIEMLQGKSRLLKDGRIKYKIVITDKTKQEMVKQYLTMIFAKDALSNDSKN